MRFSVELALVFPGKQFLEIQQKDHLFINDDRSQIAPDLLLCAINMGIGRMERTLTMAMSRDRLLP